jgi:septum formation protein
VSDPAPPVLCLASASPRRRELLAQIGVPHIVNPAHIEETLCPGESARGQVMRLAREKALAVYAQQTSLPVLGADTEVVLDECIFGKPSSREDAIDMLLRLSGRTHEVLTAVALIVRGALTERLNESRVTFRTLTLEECGWYWDTGEPHDKAGAYAIQGHGAIFVSGLSGSYSGVMGLPLFETGELLREGGIWPAATEPPATRRLSP